MQRREGAGVFNFFFIVGGVGGRRRRRCCYSKIFFCHAGLTYTYSDIQIFSATQDWCRQHDCRVRVVGENVLTLVVSVPRFSPGVPWEVGMLLILRQLESAIIQ